MSNSVSVWLVVLVALVAANLPFFSLKFFGFFQFAKAKTLGLRLVELVVFYFLVGALGLLLEKRVGQIASQAWGFYAITATLFITFAFPGFVYRYLVKHKS
ncbi:MAG: hypothetical protein RL682_785 [Pseudomonadota bacterium]|jgi:Protein of unknown function (DUF2818)